MVESAAQKVESQPPEEESPFCDVEAWMRG